jgi:hypothetical protein
MKSNTTSQQSDMLNVMRLMQENMANAHVQTRSCQCLVRKLSAQRNLPYIEEIYCTLTKSMASHAKVADLQKSGLLFLKLSGDGSDSHMKRLQDAGAEGVAVAAIINHPNDAKLQLAACTVLSEMCHGLPDTFKISVPIRTFVTGLVKMLKMLEQHADAQSGGLTVLNMLTKHSVDYVVEFEKQQGLALLITALRTHKRDIYVQLQGACGIMNFLVMDCKPWVQEFWKQGILEVILDAVDNALIAEETPVVKFVHDEVSFKYEASQDLIRFIMENSFFFVENMYRHINESLPKHNEPKLSIVPRAMARFLQDAQLQHTAMQSLFLAMHTCPENIGHLGQEGMRAVIAALATHDKDKKVQTAGLACLYLLANSSPNTKRLMVQDNGLQILIRNMQTCTQSLDIQLYVVELLGQLGKDARVNIKEAIIKSGSLPVIAKAMQAAKGSPKARELAAATCEAVLNLLPRKGVVTDDLKAHMLQCGLVDAVLLAMSEAPDCDTTQLFGASVLKYMVSGYGAAIKAVASRACLALIRAIPSLKDVDVAQTMTCTLFQEIVDSLDSGGGLRKFQDDLAEEAGIKALCDCIKVYDVKDRALVAQNACVILRYAILGHKENQRRCEEVGAVDVLVDLISAPRDDFDLQRELLHMVAIDALKEMPRTCTVKRPATSRSGADAEPGARDSTRGGKGDMVMVVLADFLAEFDDGDHDSHAEKQDAACKQPQPVPHAHGQLVAHVRVDACVACGKTSADVGVKALLRCSACSIAPLYCSVECQRACRKAHKAECKANKKAN